MKYKVILALLEGPHDVAFVYRILKEIGFKSTKKIIKDLPSPLNLYLSNPRQFQSATDKLHFILIPIPTRLKVFRYTIHCLIFVITDMTFIVIAKSRKNFITITFTQK